MAFISFLLLSGNRNRGVFTYLGKKRDFSFYFPFFGGGEDTFFPLMNSSISGEIEE